METANPIVMNTSKNSSERSPIIQERAHVTFRHGKINEQKLSLWFIYLQLFIKKEHKKENCRMIFLTD